jgi:hypothetical protein
MTVKAWFIGGPFDGVKTELDYAPPYVILAEKHRYERIDDPDTEEYLGGYAYVPPNNAPYAVNMLPKPEMVFIPDPKPAPFWKKWFK